MPENPDKKENIIRDLKAEDEKDKAKQPKPEKPQPGEGEPEPANPRRDKFADLYGDK